MIAPHLDAAYAVRPEHEAPAYGTLCRLFLRILSDGCWADDRCNYLRVILKGAVVTSPRYANVDRGRLLLVRETPTS
jgi:hypothetical protein